MNNRRMSDQHCTIGPAITSVANLVQADDPECAAVCVRNGAIPVMVSIMLNPIADTKHKKDIAFIMANLCSGEHGCYEHCFAMLEHFLPAVGAEASGEGAGAAVEEAARGARGERVGGG